jgi:uncharacterized iron-regulated protein
MSRSLSAPVFCRHAFAATCAAAALIAGCAGRPEAPRAVSPGGSAASRADTQTRLNALLPADAILIGEQHDVAQHQQVAQQVIADLAGKGLLAAVAIEMAESGTTTGSLQPSSTEEQTRAALRWNDTGWSWAAYGPAVMTAVRAGVPVLGANLPMTQMRDSMRDSNLDRQLPGPALKEQQQLIRAGHCNLLPESQIAPMTRVQIARDLEMAQTVKAASLPGKTVVLMAGNGHVNRALGVPRHLPDDMTVRAVRLAATGTTSPDAAAFDSVWPEGVAPAVDHCAQLRKQLPAGAAKEAGTGMGTVQPGAKL